MIRPHLPRCVMPGMAAWMAWKALERLIAMMASQRSGGKFAIRRHVLDAGVVDQNIEAAQFGLGAGHHGGDGFGAG